MDMENDTVSQKSQEVVSKVGKRMEDGATVSEEADSQAKKKRKYYNISVQKIHDEFKWIDASKDFLFCKICNIKLSGARFHLKRHQNNLNHKKGTSAVRNAQNLNSMVFGKNTFLSQQIRAA